MNGQASRAGSRAELRRPLANSLATVWLAEYVTQSLLMDIDRQLFRADVDPAGIAPATGFVSCQDVIATIDSGLTAVGVTDVMIEGNYEF